MTRTLADRLAEIARRAPDMAAAFEVLINAELKRLGPEDASTKPHTWKCDAPDVVNRKPATKGGARDGRR